MICLPALNIVYLPRSPALTMEKFGKTQTLCDDPDCASNLEALQKEIDVLKSNAEQLALENQNLKNQMVDREYERGCFVEEDVLQKLEEENRNLRVLLEDYYKAAFNEWFEEVRKHIISEVPQPHTTRKAP